MGDSIYPIFSKGWDRCVRRVAVALFPVLISGSEFKATTVSLTASAEEDMEVLQHIPVLFLS